MVDQEKIKFKCPKCQQEVEAISFSTINVTLNPELKEKLFSGELFVKECTKCKENIQVLHGFLYHDMSKKFMISYGDEAEHVQELMQNLSEEMQEKNLDLESFYAGYRIRATRNINDLFEKIYIFEEGFDDRVIEFCKLLIFQELAEDTNFKQDDILDIRYMPKEVLKQRNEIKEDDIGINVYCKNDKAWVRSIKSKFYDQCADYVLKNMKNTDFASNLVIDAEWLKENLE